MSVYANGRAIIHKGDGHRQISGTPDVCKTPSPAGPVPIPYPNLASDSDLAKGSKSVKIEGNPAALRSSHLKTSTGDEPGTAGGGLISSKTRGKVTWTSSSPDVRIEGKNSVRFLDICLHNGNMANSGGQPTNSKGTAPATINQNCLHCGRPLSDPSHNNARIDNDDDSLMKKAVVQKKSGHMKGGIQVGDRCIFAASAGKSNATVTPRNLASGEPLNISANDRRRWSKARPKGNPPGCCVEQILLDRAFPAGAGLYPPPTGTTIRMGVALVDEGTVGKKITKAIHRPKCATCEEVMIAMLCTNKKS